MKKLSFKGIKKNIKQGIHGIRYDLESAPWLKMHEKNNVPTTLVYPECTMYDLLEKAAIEYPTHLAFEYFNKDCTYKDFIDRIKRCAKALLNIGVTSDSTVTLLMPNTPEGIICFYACNMIGAVANMVHPLSSETEIEYCVNKAGSKFLLTLDALYDKLYEIKDNVKLKKIFLVSVAESMPAVTTVLFKLTKGRKIKITKPVTDNVIMWKDFLYEGRDTELIKSNKKDTDLAVILYSGGTTGSPKGVMHSSRTFNVTAIQHHAVCPDAREGKSILCILPIFHGFGLGICFHTTLTTGMKCYIIPKFTPAEFGKLIKTYKPNFIAGVPTLYEALMQTDMKGQTLSYLTTCLSGGDTLTPDLHNKINAFLDKHGSKANLKIGWGMTETVASATATPTSDTIPGSIGIPNPDNACKIVKPGTTENVFYDEDGELCVTGPTVMMGYIDDEEETNIALKKHDDGKVWLHTGDMASMTKEGMIFFKSRIKRMIISSGYNIYPNHIEGVLNSHPKVLTSIVVGAPHPYKGEIAKAYVVLKPEYKETEEIDQELKEYCAKNLAKYSLPSSIEYRETLPVTKIGKADYRNVK